MFSKTISLSPRAAFLFFIFWLLLMSLLFDLWPVILAKEDWATITHSQYGFVVDYPTKWVAKTYGEHGYHGIENQKLRIYPPLGDTYITFRYTFSSEPSLESAAMRGSFNLDRFRDVEAFAESSLQEDAIRGIPILRRKYRVENLMFEDVYIARSEDIIIITMQSSVSNFDKDYDEFEAIVDSFRPLD